MTVGRPEQQIEAPGPQADRPLWRRAGGWYGLTLALIVLAGLRLAQLGLVVWMAEPGVVRDRLLIWDANWLIRVAVEGYPTGYTYLTSGRITGNGLAFFPMYPLLVRLGTVLGLPADASSLLVAGVASGCAGVLIYLLGTSLWSRRAGYVLMVLICSQPMSVVLGMGYTESLFLALLAGALLAAHRRVWWAAGALGLAAALTRPTGAAVGVALAVAAYGLWRAGRAGTITLRPRELPQAIAAAVVALAGVPAFLAWVGWRVGDWDAWFTVQTKGWGSTLDLGQQTGSFLLRTLHGGRGVVELTTAWLIIGAVVLCLVAATDRTWPPLLTYGLITLALVVGQGGYWHSKPRLLVPVALLACVPLARAIVKAPPRTGFALLALWTAYGLWFGSHMITVWPLAI